MTNTFGILTLSNRRTLKVDGIEVIAIRPGQVQFGSDMLDVLEARRLAISVGQNTPLGKALNEQADWADGKDIVL